MKNNSSLLAATILAVTLFATTGCPQKTEPSTLSANASKPGTATLNSKATQTDPLAMATSASTPEPAAILPDPFSDMIAALEKSTKDQHVELTVAQQSMDQEIDAQVAALKAAGNSVSLAAAEKLDAATEDFAEKLRQLTLASSETWENSKHNAELALQDVRSAYAGIMNQQTQS